MELYLVTFNGWRVGYGVEIYLIGIFDNIEDATNAIPKDEEEKEWYKMHVVNLNQKFEVRSQKFPYPDTFETDVFLGGYVE